MNQQEALNLAIEMLERVAPGTNYDAREFYRNLREIKSTTSFAGSRTIDQAPKRGRSALALSPGRATKSWPRTAILAGEEYREIDRQRIKGRDLIVMESCRDEGEAPWIMVDAGTNEIVMDEVRANTGSRRGLGRLASSDHIG